MKTYCWKEIIRFRAHLLLAFHFRLKWIFVYLCNIWIFELVTLYILTPGQSQFATKSPKLWLCSKVLEWHHLQNYFSPKNSLILLNIKGGPPGTFIPQYKIKKVAALFWPSVYSWCEIFMWVEDSKLFLSLTLQISISSLVLITIFPTFLHCGSWQLPSKLTRYQNIKCSCQVCWWSTNDHRTECDSVTCHDTLLWLRLKEKPVSCLSRKLPSWLMTLMTW